MAYVTVQTEVSVDLRDIDTDDLLEELQERNVDTNLRDARNQRQAMLKALWEGDDAKALELLKQYLCDCLGRAAI